MFFLLHMSTRMAFQHFLLCSLLSLGIIQGTLAETIKLGPGSWSKDVPTDIATSFSYKSVGGTVEFEVIRTSTLNKTSTQPTPIFFDVASDNTGKTWTRNVNLVAIGPNSTESGDTYTLQVTAESGAPVFTYAVRACEGSCESSSLKKCFTITTFCSGNGACKLGTGICVCDDIDWSAQMDKLPSYLKGVAKADNLINQFISDQCNAPLDTEAIIDYLSHYFVIICIVAGFAVLVLIAIIVGLCFCCGCCKCKRGPVSGVYQPVDRFEAAELSGFDEDY